MSVVPGVHSTSLMIEMWEGPIMFIAVSIIIYLKSGLGKVNGVGMPSCECVDAGLAPTSTQVSSSPSCSCFLSDWMLNGHLGKSK